MKRVWLFPLINHIDRRTLYSYRRLRRAGQDAFNEIARGADFHTILSREAVLLSDGLLKLENDGGRWEQEFRR